MLGPSRWLTNHLGSTLGASDGSVAANRIDRLRERSRGKLHVEDEGGEDNYGEHEENESEIEFPSPPSELK